MGCVSSRQFNRTSRYEDPTILAKETTCKNADDDDLPRVKKKKRSFFVMFCRSAATLAHLLLVFCSLCERGGGPPRAVPEDKPLRIQRRPDPQGTHSPALDRSFDQPIPLFLLPVPFPSFQFHFSSSLLAGGATARSLQEQQQEEPFRRSGTSLISRVHCLPFDSVFSPYYRSRIARIQFRQVCCLRPKDF
jgi:hypothetical protein